MGSSPIWVARILILVERKAVMGTDGREVDFELWSFRVSNSDLENDCIYKLGNSGPRFRNTAVETLQVKEEIWHKTGALNSFLLNLY